MALIQAIHQRISLKRWNGRLVSKVEPVHLNLLGWSFVKSLQPAFEKLWKLPECVLLDKKVL